MRKNSGKVISASHPRDNYVGETRILTILVYCYKLLKKYLKIILFI